MTKYALTPWYIAQHGNSGPKWEIRCAGHGNIADMRDNGRNREHGEELAAFIVRAVNNHEALIAAMERVADMLPANAACGVLRAALAKAKES